MSKYETGKATELVYEEIKYYIKKYGYPPSVREIGEIMGFTSPATVQYHLDKLVKNGYIEKGNGRNRAIKLLK